MKTFISEVLSALEHPERQRHKWGEKQMADLLVVKAKIKDAAKGCNVAGDFAEALDKKLRQLVTDACARAEGNGRKTVMAKDL